MDFIEDVYRITTKFPVSETYGLTSQLRRAAISIALNIAEGSGSGSDKEFNRFLTIALKSSYELICGIEVARRLKYFEDEVESSLLKKCDEISAMISGLRKSLNVSS